MDVRDVRVLGDDAEVPADVCIVGAGPAGLTIARELSGSGVRVVLLESGGVERDPERDALSEIESIGAPRTGEHAQARNRVVGGSSATWWGRLATFDDVDFAEREWVPHSGWPFPREELRPYFARALPHIGGTVADNNEDGPVGAVAATLPGLDTATFRPYAWTYSRDAADRADAMRFGPRALAEAMPGVQCFTNAVVTHIDTNPEGTSVERLEVRAPDGRRVFVRARHVVLCAGGIENARLLLASDRIVRTGVGNARGTVGRFLMDHPRGPVAYYHPEDFVRVQRLFGEHRLKTPPGTTRLAPGLAPSAAFQASQRLLNCAFWIEGLVDEDVDPLSAAHGLMRREAPGRNLRAIGRRPGLALEGLKRALVDGRTALRTMASVGLMCISEQPPDPDSRITLSERTDALGVRLAVVDWRIGEQEARTVRCATRRFAEEMRRLGLPVPEPLPVVADDSVPFHLPDAFHPTGATRMSVDPAAGVVDPHGAVHGVRGLHVAGSSVFPTSGHANPTQMIVAMSVRLADRLQVLLDEREQQVA